MHENMYENKPWLKLYPSDVPHRLDIPLKTVNTAFDEAVTRFGMDKTSIIFYGRRITNAELKDQIDRFAGALYRLGIRKGDRIVLFLVNCPQMVIAFMAALKLGAIVSPMNPSYVAPEIKYRLEDTGAETIICLDLLYGVVEKTGKMIKNIILTSIDEYLPPSNERTDQRVLPAVYDKMQPPSQAILNRNNVYQFQELIDKNDPVPPPIAIDPMEDIAVLPYTGGTTGMPKGVMLTHHYLMAALLQDAAFWPEFKDGEEILAGYMPFFHIAGLCQMMLKSLVVGYTNVIISNPDLDDLLAAIEKYGLTFFAGSPGILEAIMQKDIIDDINWKRLKAILVGSDILKLETIQKWESRTGTSINVAWGLTEFTAATTTLRKFGLKEGSIGVPEPNIVAAIVELGTTKFLPFGQVGEILLSGPNMMKGYWNHPEETAEAIVNISGKKWFRTGDLARMDEYGQLFFAGRAKYMIKHKGYAIYPPEIETVIRSHPDVSDVAVIGIPNPVTGEDPVAVVVPSLNRKENISDIELLKFCKENLAHIKLPTTIVFVNELPKTSVGKVDRATMINMVIKS